MVSVKSLVSVLRNLGESRGLLDKLDFLLRGLFQGKYVCLPVRDTLV